MINKSHGSGRAPWAWMETEDERRKQREKMKIQDDNLKKESVLKKNEKYQEIEAQKFKDRIDKGFDYNLPCEGKLEKIKSLTLQFKALARSLQLFVPPCREEGLAINALQQALHLSVAAISNNKEQKLVPGMWVKVPDAKN